MPIAPVRDFTKVANSITREAIPAGVFKGKSKQLYDYLYAATRGAIVPSRSVRLARTKLMAAAGIGSRVTFDSNIQRLCQAGLLRVRSIAGEHEGNEYTVYLPEEAIEDLTEPGLASQTSPASMTSPAHKLDTLVGLETTPTSPSVSIAHSTTSEGSKTFFKTLAADDDEAAIIAAFAVPITAAASQIIGAALAASEIELERWRDLAALLSEEMQIAARRAGPVSSAPAFFAAHLRRRLARAAIRQAPAQSNGGARDDEPRSEFAAEQWTPDDKLLTSFIEAVKGRITEEAFTTWFLPTRAMGVSDGRLYIQVPNGVFEQSIKFNYAELLDEVRLELGLGGCEIRFVY